MVYIKPVSDLRNKFPEIESIVNDGDPMFLTKNGYGTMIVLTDNVETKLDEADKIAKVISKRYTHDTVFQNIRNAIDE